MQRPAVFILIYTLLGILAAMYITSYNSQYIFIFSVMILTLIIIAAYRNLAYILLAAAAFAAFYIAANSGLYTNNTVDSIADTSYPVSINAVVNDRIKSYEDSVKYSITTNKMTYGSTIVNDNINMYMYTKSKLNIGDIISFEAKISHGSIKRNESDFDEIRYFKIKGIEYKISLEQVTVIGHINTLKGSINNLSQNIQNTINTLYPPKEAGLMTAMLLGDKNNVDDEIYQLYRDAGIVHTIAISGLHISILAGIILLFTKSLGKYLSSAIVIVFLAFYVLLTGGSVSVVRASIMMCFYIFSGIIGRKYDLISSAAVACCVLLCANPYYIFDLGFQYSFISVFTIGFTSEILKLYKIKNKFINLIIISLAVSLATKPITAHSFYYINCIDFILNVIVVSLMQFVIAFGLLSAVAGLFIISAGIFIAGPAYALLNAIEFMCDLSLKMPFSHIQTGAVSIISVLLLYAMGIFIYKLLLGKLYALPFLILTFTLLFVNVYNRYTGFEAEFMYVGQGDCTLFKDKNKCYIMDIGSSYYQNYGEAVLNQLQYDNISKINGIYISHMDYDHMGGIIEIMGLIPIDNIYVSSYCEHNDNYNTLVDLAEENNINIIYVKDNYAEQLTENMSIKLVYVDKYAEDTNNSSLVYKLTYDDKSILFTGDIGSQNAAMASKYDVNADVLKVPHHGAKNSISYLFLKSVSPDIAVNFAGNNNVYSHPNNETVAHYNNMNIPFFSTNYNGILRIRIIENKIYFKLINTNFLPIETLKNTDQQ